MLAQFAQGLQDVIPESALDRIATASKPLKIKFGADPSAPDLHIGHMVVLKKLRILQDMGHLVQFLVGDFTAMIGDPTGKSETRKPLTSEQVKANAESYKTQVFKLLDPAKTQVVFNSEWLDKLTSREMIKLSAQYTVARMLERDDFQKRFSQERPISIHEFLYPLLQGYDSVVLENDIEMGGTDQKFNVLMGRHLQKEYGKPVQAVITAPLLEGVDGVQKMSKSLGNHIGLLESGQDQFGKIMSIPDTMILKYFSLITDASPEELLQFKFELDSGKNPKFLKEELGVRLVSFLHSPQEAMNAKEAFNRVFSQKLNPEDMPVLSIPPTPTKWTDFMVLHGMAPSKKEASRLIEHGAVSLDGEILRDSLAFFLGKPEQVLKVGKRRFYRFK